MSLFSLLNIARDGIQVHSTGVSVTGQNITNVNTPGYVQRGAVLVTRPNDQGGVSVTTVARSFDRRTHARSVEEHGRRGAADARSNALASVEAILAPSSTTIADRTNAFFRSLDTLTASPADPSARQTVLQQASNLAQQISDTANDLQTQRGDLFNRARGVATEVNERLVRIASLNGAIADATNRGDPGNDLRDQRDQLVQEVGDRVGARAVEDEFGRVTLFAAGGVLVDADRAASLGVDLDPGGNLRVQVQRPGAAAIDVTSAVTQGSLGGIREARDADIPRVSAALDSFAFDFATAVNTVHSSGVGLDGTAGRPLFATTATATGAARALTVDPALVGRPERLAAATRAAGLPGDNSVALQLAGLAGRPLGGVAPPAERFGAIAADLGSRVAAAEAESTLRADTVTQADNLHASASGVSLDEEMVNLSRFQRAFDASTRVLRVADELLDTLIKSF